MTYTIYTIKMIPFDTLCSRGREGFYDNIDEKVGVKV
jgi:hypothetical protein